MHWNIELSWGWYILLFLVIAGTANGVNLTDGVDGLAAGTGIIALLTFTAISVVTYIRSGNPGGRFDSRLDLAIVGAALIGAAIGFLWYNAFPAELIMGDTGAMAIGGALAAMAIFTKTIFLLLFIGGIFLIEAAVGDPAGRVVQVLGTAHLPHDADPSPLRDEGLVGDEDHGALLDRDGDPVRRRLRALLQRLHLLQTLSGDLDRVLDDARLERGDRVVVVGTRIVLLALAAAERVGPDGEVFAIDRSVAALEELRAASGAADISYLVGQPAVLPLPDASVDAVLADTVPGPAQDGEETLREFNRVLAEGGRLSLWNEPVEET